MVNPIGSLHAKIARMVVTKDLTVEQANPLHDLLSGRENPSWLIVLKFAVMHAYQRGVLSDDQIARLFDLIPELRAV